MADAINNGRNGSGPEHITRGEFQNVVGAIMSSIERIENNFSDTAKEFQNLKQVVSPILADYEDKKQEKHDNRVAVMGFILAIASTVISTMILITLKLSH